MAGSIDLSKLKTEIHNRKTSDDKRLEENGTPRMPKNQFMSNLVAAVRTGNPNEVSEKVRSVAVISDNLSVDPQTLQTSFKPGVNPNDLLNKIPTPVKKTQKPRSDINESLFNQPQTQSLDGEREPGIYNEIERRQREYSGQGINLNQYTNNLQPQNYPQQGNLNIGNISIEQLENLFNTFLDKYLKTKMVDLMKDVTKSAIIDQYTSSVVKNNILQSKDAVREVLKEIIKETNKK